MYNIRRHLHIYLTKLLLFYYYSHLIHINTPHQQHNNAVQAYQSSTNQTPVQTQSVSPSQSSQCQSMWKYPPNCISNCSYHIVWRYNQQDDGIDFIVTTKYAQRWTGVGFSLDRSMINSDAIIAWIEDGSRYVMMDAWMPSYNTPIADQQQNIHNISAATTNGLISFKFSRKRSTGDTSQDLSFTDDKCLYMIYPVSGGNVDIKNRVLLKHETTPIVSQHPICVRSCQYQQQQQPTTATTSQQPKPNRATLAAPPPPPSPSPAPSSTSLTSTRLRSSGNQQSSPARPAFVNSILSLQSATQSRPSSSTSTTTTTTTTTTTPAAPLQPPPSSSPTTTSTTTTSTTTTTPAPTTSSTTTTTTTPAPIASSSTTTSTTPTPTTSSTTTTTTTTQAPTTSSTTIQPSTTSTSTTSQPVAPSVSTSSTTQTSGLEASSSVSVPNVDNIDPNQQWCQGRFAYPINCRFYPSSQTQHLQLPPILNQLNSISPLPLEHSDCNYYAQWQYLEASDQIEFIIQTKTRNKWTGIGFSNNTKMADSDAIIGLVEENGRHFIMDTWLKDHVMPELDKVQNTNNTSAKRENGTTTVKFRRKRITNDPLDFQFTDDSCAYFFFPVSGGMFNAVNKRLRQHEKIPIISKNRICIKSCTNTAKNNNLSQSSGNNTDNLVTTSIPINEDVSMNTKVPISYNVDNKSPSQDEDGNDLSPSTISTISSNLDPLSGVSTSSSTTSNPNVNVQASSSTSGPPLDLSADLDSHPAVPSTKASSASNNPFKKINFLNDSGFRWLAGIGSVAVLILMIMLQACYTVYRNKKTKRQDAINAQWRLAEVAAVQQKVGNKLYNLSGINGNAAINNGTTIGTGVGNAGKLVYDDDIDFDHGDIQRLSRDITTKDPYIHHHSNNHLIGHNGNINNHHHHQYNGNDIDDPRGEPFYDADEYFTNSTAAYLNSNNINDCTTATESSGTEENDGDMMQLQNQDMIMPNSYSLGRHNRPEGNDYIHNSHTGHRSHNNNNRVPGHHNGRHHNNTNHHQHHHHHHQQQQHYSRSHHHQTQQHNHAGYNGGGGRGHPQSRDNSRENYNSNYISPYPQHQMVAPTNSYTLRHNNGYNNPSTLIRPDSYFLPSQRRYSSTNPPP